MSAQTVIYAIYNGEVEMSMNPTDVSNPGDAGGATGTNSRADQHLPTRKVAIGGLAGACSVVLIGMINTFWPHVGHHISAEIASAITTIITFIVSYMIPEATQ